MPCSVYRRYQGVNAVVARAPRATATATAAAAATAAATAAAAVVADRRRIDN